MKLVILDRDGVINEDSDDYIKSVAEWQPIPGSLEAIARLSQAGFHVAIASNQSGIGRGLFDYDALFSIHERMQKAVAELGGRIDLIEFCPDSPEQATLMRKPQPGMLIDIGRRLQTSLEGVPFIGDSASDYEAATKVGARAMMVRTGKGAGTIKKLEGLAVDWYDDLAGAAAALLGR